MQKTNVLSFAGLVLALAVSGSLGWTALWVAPVIGLVALGMRALEVNTPAKRHTAHATSA